MSKPMTFKKGDILTVTFTNGVDAGGKAVLLTIERAEVLGCPTAGCSFLTGTWTVRTTMLR